jgi:tetratricopeptide (TPR) repeat protein
MVGGALLLVLATAAPVQDTSLYARAESLLVEGELGEARRQLERAVRRNREDTRALTLLGRVHLEWPVIGRWKAWDYLERAAKADTTDPEARYWQAQVGLRLAMEDGQWMIRRALLDVWRIDPEYKDTWAIAEQIYWNDDHRRSAAQSLSRSPGNTRTDLLRAWFLVQAGEYPDAATVLDSLIAAGRDDASVWALKAQCALERGDTTGGLADYERALERAASDTLDLLWQQARGIASPEEDSVYVTLPPGERAAFLRSFWSQREPDLTTAGNERIVEHFSRLAHARDYYPLLHPQATFHRSELNRALYSGMSGGIIQSLGYAFGVTVVPMPGRSRIEDDATRAGLGVDIRDLPEPDSVTRYRTYGFDGRGLVYLRYGEPDRRLRTVGPVPVDAEQWYYETPNGIAAITFASVVGDMLLYPTNRTELHNSALVLETDDTSIPATLDVYAWVATFRGAIDGYHLVYVGATPDSGAAALWDSQWTELARVTGSAPFVFHVGAQRYSIGVDVKEGDQLGRLRAQADVPYLWLDRLTVSSLLVASLADTAYSREEIARAMPGTRRLSVAEPLAFYSEIYELTADSSGLARYEIEYAFEQDGEQVLAIRFQRQAPAASIVTERVVLAPGRIPRGDYRISMRVRDLVRPRDARSTHIDVELR